MNIESQTRESWRHHKVIWKSFFNRWPMQEQHSKLLDCKHQFEFVELACCNSLMSIQNDIFGNSVFWNKIFKTQTSCLLKKYYICHSQAVWNLISIYLQRNRIYILCISSIYSVSTSISMFHHKWPACDLLTLENFLFAACLLRLNHVLIRLTPENFYRTKLQKVWSINSRTKIGFEWF